MSSVYEGREEVMSEGTGEEVTSERTQERKQVLTRARAHRTLKAVE